MDEKELKFEMEVDESIVYDNLSRRDEYDKP